MKILFVFILFLTFSNYLFAQGLYCKTNKKTELILPELKTNVEVKKGELFKILSSYNDFFLVIHKSINDSGAKGYIRKNDVTTFIEYDIKRPGSLQSFVPVADTIYNETWDDTTIQKWNKIAKERNGKPLDFEIQLDSN